MYTSAVPTAKRPSPVQLTLLLASVAFFFSGFAALIYQIVWQRLLVLPLGADVYSTTIVVAAFMAGLGLGSLAGGHIADRLTPARNLQVFVAAELAVGAFGFVSRRVFYDWYYLSLSVVDLPQAAMVFVAFSSLLWPTFWMGVSLPVLGKAVSGGGSGAARVGMLYGLNTLGAAAGAFLSTWVVMPRLGLDGAIRVAAILNVVAAVSVLALQRSLQSADNRRLHHAGEFNRCDARLPSTGWSFRTWAWLYGLAGFQALSLEILWFRLLGVMVKASAFTFGTLLTIYLAGLGLGAALASLWVSRVRRPEVAFLSLQAFAGLYAALSIAVLITLLESGDALSLSSYFAEYEPLDAAAAFAGLWSRTGTSADRAQFILLYVGLPAALVGPPTIALGASFPFIQKLVLVDLARLGRRVGTVVVANIAGSAVGSVACGWMALTWLGSAATLKALALLSGGFLTLAAVAATAGSRGRWRATVSGAAMAVAGAVALSVPDQRTLWAELHASPPRWVVHNEDASGLSLIKAETHTSGNRGIVFVNGIGQSWIPYGNIHSVLGALPAFVHPHPTSAALIGLGSGDTLYSLAGRQELTDVTSIEIIRPQIDTLREWARLTDYPALTSLLVDPRIRHVYGDGRSFIMRSRRQYDIIEADALRPTSAYSGNLYSVGYFELMRSRLTESGLAVTWSPTPRIHDTFVSVFPHVLSFGDIVLGSNAPIAFDPSIVRDRLRAPAVGSYFGRAAIDIKALLDPYLNRSPHAIAGGTRAVPRDDLDEDLFPRDEFAVPRRR